MGLLPPSHGWASHSSLPKAAKRFLVGTTVRMQPSEMTFDWGIGGHWQVAGLGTRAVALALAPTFGGRRPAFPRPDGPGTGAHPGGVTEASTHEALGVSSDRVEVIGLVGVRLGIVNGAGATRLRQSEAALCEIREVRIHSRQIHGD